MLSERLISDLNGWCNTYDKQVAELLAKKQSIFDKEKEIKLAEVKKIIQQFGFTSIDLGLSNIKKKFKLKIKYVNPDNTEETWHGGTGAKPQWVREFLDGGGKLETIAVDKPYTSK